MPARSHSPCLRSPLHHVKMQHLLSQASPHFPMCVCVCVHVYACMCVYIYIYIFSAGLLAAAVTTGMIKQMTPILSQTIGQCLK